MEIYLLKSAACLGILYLFYKIVLENTALHATKRIYLIGSLVISFLIPFITFTEYIEAVPTFIGNFSRTPITNTETGLETTISNNYLPYILGIFYIIGVLIFTARFGKNLYCIFKKVRQNSKIKNGSIFHVLIKSPITPHSFLNYIFFSKKAYQNGKIPKEVITHETAHVIQKHSWDIIFIELLCIVFWFNPLLYFIKHSIKLNHEFLADRSVIHQGTDASIYQKILLDFSSTSSVPEMAHSINYSSIKKRFTVMKTKTSKQTSAIKLFLILPLLVVLIYGFSEKKQEITFSETDNFKNPSSQVLNLTINKDNEILIEENVLDLFQIESIIQNENYSKVTLAVSPKASIPFAKSIVTKLIHLNLGKNLSVFSSLEGTNGLSVEAFNEITSPLKEYNSAVKASAQQIDIYNRLAKKYNAQAIEDRKIPWEDLMSLENIYRLMTTTQKKNALPFPECLPKNQTSWEVAYAKQFNEGAKRNNQKSIVITINDSKIMIDGISSSLSTFAKDLDKVTKDWTDQDFKEVEPSVLITATPESFLKKIETEYRKTKFFKESGKISFIPPPPPLASKAPKRVIKGVNDHDTNNPPPPPFPKVIKGVNDMSDNIPPPPPPAPPVPLDHVIEMAKDGATFYYEGNQISSDDAIKIVKKNKSINISTIVDGSTPVVNLTTKPIVTDN
jgi:bla regulator protein BlaR1